MIKITISYKLKNIKKVYYFQKKYIDYIYREDYEKIGLYPVGVDEEPPKAELYEKIFIKLLDGESFTIDYNKNTSYCIINDRGDK